MGLYLHRLLRFYAGLGTLRNFHDELIIFAYQRQIDVDPANTGYYLECLQGIARGRNSDELETKTVMEKTSDKISNSDVRNAYKELGIPTKDIDDDTVLGLFQARLADAPKHQEEDLRRALKIIGADRVSRKIEEAASMGTTPSPSTTLLYIFLILTRRSCNDVRTSFVVSQRYG